MRSVIGLEALARQGRTLRADSRGSQGNCDVVSLIAGGAGFIGVNLAHRLLSAGETVVAADNFSRGRREALEAAARRAQGGALRVVSADLSTAAGCEAAFQAASALGGVARVWHLAANSDIPAGVADSAVDLKDTFLTTYELLRAMQRHGATRLVFASSSAVYGDLGDRRLSEDAGPLLPISNYGAMKLASEAQISAAAESFLRSATILRFPNVVGTPATHGVVLDLVRKLKADPSRLPVLGDGEQRKPYLHVSDLVDAMLRLSADPPARLGLWNLGPEDEGVTVRWIAQQVVARAAPTARIEFGEGRGGWVGDVPRFRYDVSRAAAAGWRAEGGSEAAMLRAIDEIALQEGVPLGGLSP